MSTLPLGVGNGARLLLFGEDATVLSQEGDQFQGAGFLVDTADSLAAAVSVLRQHMPDAAVLHSRSKGDAASLLAATILLKYRGTRVVVVTYHADPAAEANLDGLGVTRRIKGPANFSELLALVLKKDQVRPRITHYSGVSSAQIDALKNLHDRAPDQADTQWLLGFAYYRAGQFREALPLLEQLSRSDLVPAQVHYYLGSTHYQLGEYDRARRYWGMASERGENPTISARAREHLQRLDQELSA